MLKAELKGKLPEVENLEDILTSNFFTLIRYIPFKDCFLKILEQTKDYSSGKRNLLDRLTDKIDDLDPTNYSFKKVFFWPNSNVYGEPDIIVILESSIDIFPDILFCIEVKYLSKKSSEEEGDQLKRYFEALSKKRNRITFSEPEISNFKGLFMGIIYLTDMEQSEEVIDSINQIKNDLKVNPEESLFELRWKNITKIINEINSEENKYNHLLKDLQEYLIYKNFKDFDGFTIPYEDIFSLDTHKIFYHKRGLFFKGVSYVPMDIVNYVNDKRKIIFYKGG